MTDGSGVVNEVPGLVNDMTDSILRYIESNTSSAIFLGGYSRGAHAVRLIA